MLIPFQNKKDLEDIPADILKKIKIVPVKMIDEVLKHALERYPSPVARPERKGKSPADFKVASSSLSAEA